MKIAACGIPARTSQAESRCEARLRVRGPYPIPSQAWSLDEREGRWFVNLRLGDRRWRLRLRGGPHMRYQVARLRQIAAGEAEAGAATIYQVRAQEGDHRSGLPSGGRLGSTGGQPTRVMLKLAAWFPKADADTVADRSGVISVRTGADALLSVTGHDWRIDAAPLRGVLCAEARRRAGLAVNLKHERRRPRRQRQGITDALNELSRRSRLRIADACRTYAAHVTAYAIRQRVTRVEYDDGDRSALPGFPWEQLRTALANKLDEHRIELVHVNASNAGNTSAGRAEPEPKPEPPPTRESGATAASLIDVSGD